MPERWRPLQAISAQKKLPNLFAEVSLALAEKIFRLVLQSQIKLNRERGVVERFIAPVLKTGEPSRVPGVRIPPPLLLEKGNSKGFSFLFIWFPLVFATSSVTREMMILRPNNFQQLSAIFRWRLKFYIL